MKKIELSISTAMSLLCNSTSGSEEEIIENEEGHEIEEDDSDVLGMSDEDFENMSEAEFEKAASGEDENQEANEEDTLGDDDNGEESTEVNEEEQETAAADDGSEQTEEGSESEGSQPNEAGEETQTRYEAAYNDLFGQPIKASGREIQLRDTTQVRNLVEMGVDYNKKMQHMRPHMQVLKTLEKEGILDDMDQMNLLLEAKKGNPDAIRKLIQDNNIDMLDLADAETPKEYKAQNHMVSQHEIEVDNALSAIKESPAYETTINVMTNVFDQKSKDEIIKNPTYITSINQDIENGIFGKVMDMVQYQRDVRAIPDTVSDIDAYIATVQQMAVMERQEGQPASNQAPGFEPTASPQPARRRQGGSSNQQKAAMSGSRRAPKTENSYDPIDILGMSDKDFEKKFGGSLQ